MNFYQVTNKSFDTLGVSSYKGLWEKVSQEHKGLSISVDTEFKQIKENENKFVVTMSTSNRDRHGDIVMQNWDLKPFKQNPVFLDSHNYGSIEHIIGKVNNVKIKDGRLTGEVEFNLDNPKGLLAYNMAQKGFLNATSVGFIPLSFTDKGDIEKSELLELSAVSVPANAEALFERAIKGMDIEGDQTDDEQVDEQVDGDVDVQSDEGDEIVADEIIEAPSETDEADTEKEVKSLIKDVVHGIKKDIEERKQRKERLIKQVTNLMDEIASGRSSKRSVNKAVKKLLEIKKIN